MRFLAILIALLSTSVFAQQEQKLANGQWAYYGEDFYKAKALKNIDRAVFDKIFNHSHSSLPGKSDVIATSCTQKGGTCYSHVSVGYDSARKIMFGELDKLTDSKGTYVLDVYCGKKFYFRDLDNVSDMHTEVNIEHTWPQSKFSNRFKKDMQKSDMHHLYLTDSQANSTRGNSPFGLVDSFDDRMGGSGCRISKMGFIDGNDVYTPPVNHRGNVARSLFYFSMHYALQITQKEEKILREWHKEDPVDANEIKRHEGVAKHQKVRNPFVDHPEIVDMVKDF